MGGYIKSETQRMETASLNTKINKEVFNTFKDYCKELGYPMNVMIETFMKQYINKKFKIESEDILKFKNDNSETDTLNTTFNKEIYSDFKLVCKANGYHMNHVIAAFMEKFSERNLILEYVNIEEE